MKELYTTPPITNNYRNKSEEQKAVEAMTGTSTAKMIAQKRGNKNSFSQNRNDSAIDAMDTPSTAQVIRNKRKNRQP